jgi:hypothetical protein
MEEKKKAIMPSLRAMDNRFLKREGGGPPYYICSQSNCPNEALLFYFVVLIRLRAAPFCCRFCPVFNGTSSAKWQ